jgi:hypothetical protein
VIVARSSDQSEIQIIRSHFETLGIPAVVMQDAFAGAIGQTVLRVPEAMAGLAVEFIERYRNGEFQLEEGPPDMGDAREFAGDLPSFKVYSRPDKAVPVVVKAGFSWPALVFGSLWFLLNGMWVNAIFVGLMDIGAWLYFHSYYPVTLLELCLSLLYLIVRFLIGKLGNTLLCLDLESKRYVRLTTVSAKNSTYAREAAAQWRRNANS